MAARIRGTLAARSRRQPETCAKDQAALQKCSNGDSTSCARSGTSSHTLAVRFFDFKKACFPPVTHLPRVPRVRELQTFGQKSSG